MPQKQPAVFTFHKIREQGEQGEAGAWRAFLEFYSPLYLHLVSLYAPEGEQGSGIWEKTLGALAEDNFARFRATSRQSEREFLSDVRALLLDIAGHQRPAGGRGAAPDAAPVSADDAPANPDDAPVSVDGAPVNFEKPGLEKLGLEKLGLEKLGLEKLGKIVAELPLLHQEMLFFKLAGYTDATLELVLRVAPRVAQASFERLPPDFAAARALSSDRCPWPAEWLATLHAARAAKTDKCPELHQFLRIQDGQVSWYDKEPVEKHVAHCLHCLEAWTALREVGYWRRHAPAVAPAHVEDFLQLLPLAARHADIPETRVLAKFTTGSGTMAVAVPLVALKNPVANRQKNIVAALKAAVMEQVVTPRKAVNQAAIRQSECASEPPHKRRSTP